jgi:hypothetical protein
MSRNMHSTAKNMFVRCHAGVDDVMLYTNGHTLILAGGKVGPGHVIPEVIRRTSGVELWHGEPRSRAVCRDSEALPAPDAGASSRSLHRARTRSMARRKPTRRKACAMNTNQEAFTWRATFIDPDWGALMSCSVTESMVWERLAGVDQGNRHVATDGSIRAGAWLFTFIGEEVSCLGSNAAVCGGDFDALDGLDALLRDAA